MQASEYSMAEIIKIFASIRVHSRLRLPLLAVLMVLVAACEPGPRPIAYGEAECAHCRMRVIEPAFGSQLVTKQGRTYDFDSIECLAAYLDRQSVAPEDVHSSWVPAFDDHGFIQIEEAFFLQSEGRPSPMGIGLSAYRQRTDALTSQQSVGGRLLAWPEIVDEVASRWSRGMAAH
jgi:copper chaperone NosL